MRWRLRVGRHRYKFVYLQVGPEPAETDMQVAHFETRSGARDFVDVMNALPEERFMDMAFHWTRDD